MGLTVHPYGWARRVVPGWNDPLPHAPLKRFLMKGVVVKDAALYRILEALIDEWPETVFSEQIADVLKVNREVLDA